MTASAYLFREPEQEWNTPAGPPGGNILFAPRPGGGRARGPLAAAPAALLVPAEDKFKHNPKPLCVKQKPSAAARDQSLVYDRRCIQQFTCIIELHSPDLRGQRGPAARARSPSIIASLEVAGETGTQVGVTQSPTPQF